MRDLDLSIFKVNSVLPSAPLGFLMLSPHTWRYLAEPFPYYVVFGALLLFAPPHGRAPAATRGLSPEMAGLLLLSLARGPLQSRGKTVVHTSVVYDADVAVAVNAPASFMVTCPDVLKRSYSGGVCPCLSDQVLRVPDIHSPLRSRRSSCC